MSRTSSPFALPPDPAVAPPSVVFDYHRTIIGYHGTHRRAAQRLVDGESFSPSNNRDDWLGHGIYFWEYGPQQAWWWAKRRYGDDAAVVGAMIQLGLCLDLLDPANAEKLRRAREQMEAALRLQSLKPPRNSNYSKFLDCAVFNFVYATADRHGLCYESSRAVFVPARRMEGGSARIWERSGLFVGGHIQICIREPRNILAVWSVRKDGRYGKDCENLANRSTAEQALDARESG